jgi:hypothetical protein
MNDTVSEDVKLDIAACPFCGNAERLRVVPHTADEDGTAAPISQLPSPL